MNKQQFQNKCDIVKQAGLSLIELLIALALGIFITASILQVYLGTRQSSEVVGAQLYMQESGRFAIHFVTRIVRQAGYINPSNINDDPDHFATEIVNRVNGYGGIDESQATVFPGVGNFIEGAVVVGQNNFSGSVGGVALKPDSDVLSVRLQGDPDQEMVDCSGQQLPLSENQYVDITFFVSDDDQLYCAVNNGGLSGTVDSTVALVAGIAEMQVEYGIANSEHRARVGGYVNADAVNGSVNFDWTSVLAVRVGFLSVSESAPLANDTVRYRMFDQVYRFNDGKARQVFSRAIVIRNQIWSKEA